MQAEAKKFAWDALQAVERITRFSASKTFADYQGDELFRALVENRQKYLMQHVAQEQNKTIGRLGTAPLQGPGAGAGAE